MTKKSRTNDRATPERLRELLAARDAAPAPAPEHAPRPREKVVASSPAPASVVVSGPSSGAARESSLVAVVAPAPLPEEPGLSTMEQIDRIIGRLRAILSIATDPGEVSKLNGELLRALTKRAAFEAQEATIDDKVARHPRVLRLRDAIMGALRAHPDALRDVVAALEELGE